MKVYLDNASTTKPYEKVVSLMSEIMTENYGNPSSAHSMGLEAEKIIKNAGDAIGRTLNVQRDNLIFTSGGTEADNMALLQSFYSVYKMIGRKIIISGIEHPAVSSACDFLHDCGAEIALVPVDGHGLIDLDDLKANIEGNTSLISIMYANNEVGTIQPVKEICNIKTEAAENTDRELLFHTDAVQAYGKMPMDLSSDDLVAVDLMSISAHKIHGPKGTGALYARAPQKIKPFVMGGGQQRGHRSGTENVAGIAGMGCAAEIYHMNRESNMKKIAVLRKKLLEGFMENIRDIRINSPEEVSLDGEPGKCVPNILSVSFLGTKGEVILHSLEQSGIFVSTEAACSSKKRGNSPVLTAMGLKPDEIEGTIRFSLSAFNTEDEVEYTITETRNAVEKLRKLTGYRKR